MKPSRLTRRDFAALAAAYVSPCIAADTVPLVVSSAITQSPQRVPFLRGINFTGLGHEPGSQAPHPAAVDYYIRQKRMNVVRLNITWEMMQPELNGPLDPKQVAIVEEQIERITAAGAFVILELHNYGRRSLGGVNRIIGEDRLVRGEDFADVWSRLAARWKTNSRVIWGLMNEPHDQATSTLVTVSNLAIAAIRTAGSRTMIMVSGNGWNSLGWGVTSENQKLMLSITDPADNYCFDVHHYFDDWSRGQTPNVRTEPIASMRVFTAWARANKRRAFCGEFGVGINRRGIQACRELLSHIEANTDVYIGWAWWGGGGPWQPDYIFLLDPFASVTSRINPDPIGSVHWKGPVDRPQMQMLQEFLPKAATPFNAWLIENELSECIFLSFRAGDIVVAETGILQRGKSNSMWVDGGPRKNNGVGSMEAIKAEENGGALLTRATGHLQVVNTPSGDWISVYAMLTPMKVRPQAKRCVLKIHSDGGMSNLEVSISEELPTSGENQQLTVIPLVSNLQMSSLDLTFVRYVGKSSREASARNSGKTGAQHGNINNNHMIIGAANVDGDYSVNATLEDIIILNGRVSAADDMRIQGRLYWDHGVAHLLPEGHPYRLSAPALRKTS